MTTKIITIPTKTVPGQGNIFLSLMGYVINRAPQITDTETFLAHSLREKVENVGTGSTLEVTDAEIFFLNSGIKQLREKEGGLFGADWYFFIQPLRDAEDKGTYTRKLAKTKAA